MKLKILVIALTAIVGIPPVALGSSFTVSLIQGKTPSEAVQILAEQIDSILGRVENLETQQAQTNENVTATQLEIERLQLENENLRLKTDAVFSETEDMRALNLQRKKCTELAAQISARTKVVEDPYKSRLQPLLDELRKLKPVARGIEPPGPGQDIAEIRARATSKQNEVNAINLEMEQAIKFLQNTSDVKALIEELNQLPCA